MGEIATVRRISKSLGALLGDWNAKWRDLNETIEQVAEENRRLTEEKEKMGWKYEEPAEMPSE